MKRLLGILFPAVGLLLAGCNEKEVIGVDVNQLHREVKIVRELTLSSDEVDFIEGEVLTIDAEFAEETAWEVTIFSEFNNSSKTFSGVGTSLGPIFWDGDTDTDTWFIFGESEVTLSFPYNPDTSQMVEVFVNGEADEIPADEGFLISDFEFVPLVAFGADYDRDNPPFGWMIEASMMAPSTQTPSVPRADRNKSFQLSGNVWQGFPWGPDTFNVAAPYSPFVNILRIPSLYSEPDFDAYFPFYADPGENYINLMVYNFEGDAERLRIQLYEEGGVSRFVDVKPDWEGWKMLSFNYLEFIGNEETETTPTPNPTKVKEIELLLFDDSEQDVLNTQANTVTVVVDQLSVTYGKGLARD